MTRSTVEKSFATVVLFLSTGGLLPIIFSSDQGLQNAGDGNPAIQLIWAVIYAAIAIQLALRWKNTLWIISRDWALLALVALAGLSVAWSPVPEVTLRRSIALLGTSLFGVYLAQRFTITETLRLLAWALSLAAALSLLVALLLPDHGIMTERHVGAWRGIFVHKNHLGRYMALAAVVFWTAGKRRFRFLSGVGIVVAVGLIILSTSVAALVTLLGSFVIFAFYKGMRWDARLKMAFVIAALLIGGGTGWWMFDNYENILTALGRDPTLTGRTTLWISVIESIRQHPWIGYSYGAFWNARSEAALMTWNQIGWDAPHAHNGYLEILLDVGVVGAILFGLSFGLTFSRALQWIRHHRTRSGLWPVTFLSFMLAYSLGESVFIRRNNIFWVMYVALALALAIWARSDRTIAVSEEGEHGRLDVVPAR